MTQKKTFPLRIDAGLWSEIQAWAADDLRSVNGQMEYLLREAVKARRAKAGCDLHNERANPSRDSAS